MTMNFRLKDFDGPLDLLLTLIGKAQIDIREIFVSDITDQYLSLVRSAEDLDMDEASDFLVMAATLVEIKSRAMLPRPPAPEEGEEDPETELIRRLEEYKRFKESAEELRDFEAAARNVFTKLPEEYPLPPQEVELTGLTLEGLTEAFLRIWARKPETEEEAVNHYAPRDIHRDQHTVQECMLHLMHRIRKQKQIRFEEAFSDAPTREEVVTYFLAVLELLKLGQMHTRQEGVYGEILLISGKAPFVEEPEELPQGKRRRKKKPENEPETEQMAMAELEALETVAASPDSMTNEELDTMYGKYNHG
ncbi:MAG: segregation/condensation protein A [Clostridia bacterium]|nr:segregation/condensation protein A [Clostridia bacterium]